MNDTTSVPDIKRRAVIGIMLTAAGAVIGFIGLLLPWAKLSEDFAGVSASGNGFDKDFFGPAITIALILGAVAAAAALKVRPMAIATLICGATVALLAVAGNAKVGNTRNEMEAMGAKAASDAVSTGAGVWITLVAGVLMLAGGVLAVLRSEKRAEGLSTAGSPGTGTA